jgi:hypothetical protein
MHVTIQVPEISECAARRCGYNVDGCCHAQAITVGHGLHAECDTYMRSATHLAPAPRGGVGACKVVACVHNESFACHAQAIRVRMHDEHPDCATFRPR